jgi:hypothetical protein
MKRIYLLQLVILLITVQILNTAYAQSIPSTGKGLTPCASNCQGWPMISTQSHAGGAYSWKDGPLAAPPSGNLGSNGQMLFASTYASPSIEGGMSTTMTGLTAGKKYTLKYYVMSSRAINSDHETWYATKATIQTVGAQNVHNFTPGTNTSMWIQGLLNFTAVSSSQTVSFAITAPDARGGWLSWDIKGFEWLTSDCDAGTSQVPVTSLLATTCPSGTANLAAAFTGSHPLGNIVLRWFTNTTHTGQPVADPAHVPPGTYYAFYYDQANDCYNTNQSSAMVGVVANSCAQVQVNAALSNICPATTVDLTTAIIGPIPSGSTVVWYGTPDHSGLPVIPGTAAAGVYYAFFYTSSTGTYNTNNSTAKVTVTIVSCPPACGAGTQPVPLKTTAGKIFCPATTINLVTEFFGGIKSPNIQLQFFTNPNHTGVPLSNLNVGAGIYYAFFYDPANNCYNQEISTAKITVTYADCVDLTPTLDIDGLSFGNGVARDFVVNLYEQNGRETSGNITFRITKIGGFNITYPTQSGVSDVLEGTPNENSKWTFSESANFITISSTSPIPANGSAVIGFRIQRKAGFASGLTQNITPTILTGAGGETNPNNNSIVTSVSTN